MKRKIPLKNKIHSKFIVLIWTLILVLGMSVGCGQNNEANNLPTPSEDLQDSLQSKEASARIHFIDTGNSDAILIEQNDHAALIDGGENDDEDLVVNYINDLGIERLDYVFATHPDADHIGGLDAVLTEIEVGQVFVGNGKAETKTYTDFIEAIMDKGLTSSVPMLNSTFSLGNATLKVVSVANEKDVNNCSLVVLYTYGETKAIFMGDVDQSIEQHIDVNAVGDVDLIKVGHHGSKTSSDEAFIKVISPEYAVITCGTGNKYNHPDQETLDVLNRLGISIYRTDKMGDIIFEVSNHSIYPSQEAPINKGKKSFAQKNASKEIPQEKKEVVEAFKSMEESVSDVVYYTQNGKRYHSDKNCSNMKNPIEATVDDVGNRTPCQKCYE